jgi:hypothetical protein
LRAAGYQILMTDEAVAAFGREHVVGQDVLLRQRPVWSDLRGIDVLIRQQRIVGARQHDRFIEPVHLAMIVVDLEGVIGMRHVDRIDEIVFGKRNGRSVVPHSARRAVGTRKGREKVIEAAILLNDDDDVLDVFGHRRRGRRQAALRRKRRRHRLRARRARGNCQHQQCAAQRFPQRRDGGHGAHGSSVCAVSLFRKSKT